MRFLDVEHPFFLPRWRRFAVVGFCTAWAVFEWVLASPFWAVVATGLALYTYYALILSFDAERAARRGGRPEE